MPGNVTQLAIVLAESPHLRAALDYGSVSSIMGYVIFRCAPGFSGVVTVASILFRWAPSRSGLVTWIYHFQGFDSWTLSFWSAFHPRRPLAHREAFWCPTEMCADNLRQQTELWKNQGDLLTYYWSFSRLIPISSKNLVCSYIAIPFPQAKSFQGR